ncbi:hypothetical protein [Franzmannia qiaohouensis]|uniref:Uncharacterized protein n=1 Tax=Franzmannia qiaohouensis TaxID=1329370 RepID=A0ABU1HA08_9GAMM|nr:hypothetical protein [Halomonas qiaohouensis]MDR5904293.1 hypothetical protein [Halomonas qiaohouensis]
MLGLAEGGDKARLHARHRMDRRTTLLLRREGLIEMPLLGTLGKTGNQHPILQHLTQHVGEIAQHYRLRHYRTAVHGQVAQQLARCVLMAAGHSLIQHGDAVLL